MLQELGHLEGKLIVKSVAMEVDFRDENVDTQGVDQVVGNWRDKAIIRQVKFDESLVEAQGIGQSLDLLECEEAELQV